MTLKLVHKAFLLVAIPLCLELFALYTMIESLDQSQKDTAKEAEAGEALKYVCLVMYDAIDAAGGFLMYRAAGNETFLKDFNQHVAKLEEHRTALHNYASSKASTPRQDIQAFISLVDDFSDMFAEGRTMYAEGELGGTRAAGKLRSYLKRVTNAGTLIIDNQIKLDQILRQRELDSKQLQMMIVWFAALTGLVALSVGVILWISFNRRLTVLVNNTRSIAMNKPLETSLPGSDELAQLDSDIHILADELARTRQAERAMIDNTAEIILSLDHQLRISQVNPAVMKVLGVSDSDSLGVAIQSWIHEEDRPATFDTLETCQSGSPDTAFEARLHTAEGRYIDTVWNVRWSAQNNSYFCVVHDITERKDAERLKQEVLAMVSHDLRSPLSSLKVALELLTEGILGELNERGLRVMGKAEQSVNTLINMINDLLEVEKLEFGGFSLDLQKASISEIAHQAIDMLANDCEQKGIQVACDLGDFTAQVDRDRVHRVFLNLLGNAIKFSPQGSPIEIKGQLISAETNKQMLEVRVIDRGPGIPPDKLALVFEKFRQAGRADAVEKAGSGLGLAICKAIVEAHGGKIGVDSEVGRGSSFWFHLPT